ncbi:MAG TPA: hypothetical protein VIW68_14315 [Candidatus Sulfotelmatobacter sp.]
MKNIPRTFIAILIAANWYCIGTLSVAVTAQAQTSGQEQNSQEAKGMEHDVFGTVRSIKGSSLDFETRSKKVIQVDTKPALDAHRSNVPLVGRCLEVRGSYDAKGVLHATIVLRAKDSSALWPEDK